MRVCTLAKFEAILARGVPKSTTTHALLAELHEVPRWIIRAISKGRRLR